MKILAVLFAVATCGYAQFFYAALPYAYTPTIHYSYTISAPVYAATSTQFRTQNTLGQFAFHHAGDNQERSESKGLDGAVRGAYSYVDPTGKLVNVHYVADGNGYRVLGANNLPEAPAVPDVPEVKAPEPVQDTPEVMAAKAAFQKQYEEAAKAAAAAPEAEVLQVSRRKRQALFNPLFTKTTIKVPEFVSVEGALTPAHTKKLEVKEKEQEVLTLPVSVAPTAVTAKVKVHEFEPVEGVLAPADVKRAELKEKEKLIVLPSPVSFVKQDVLPSLIQVPNVVYF